MMEATYPAYDCYKESGVQWWPSVPSHWSIKTLKHGLRIYNGQDHKDVLADEGYPVYGSGGQFAFASAYLHDGEAVLLGRKGTIDRPLHVMGKFWSVDTMFYAVCNSTLLPRFAYYYCTTIPFSYFSTATALPSMTQDDLKNNPVAFPPLPEQRAIVAFLDDKCAKIDGAVKIKEDQIALLRERRQIIIQDAVTRGLNPAAPMKDSGIDWIGQIPAHWEVKRLKHFFSTAMGETILGENLIDDGKIPVYSATEGDHFFGYVNKSRVSLSAGDLVIPARGNSIGFPKLVAGPATCSQTTIYAKKLRSISSEFVFFYLLSCKRFLFQFVQTAIPQITVDEVKNNILLLPPPQEQAELVEYCEDITQRFDGAIEIKRRQIEALNEYKTSLINAAVTGKIKVC